MPIGRIHSTHASPPPGHRGRHLIVRLFASLTGADHRGLQPPIDAFWGARYAIVEDPDGVAVGLMSPADDATGRRLRPFELPSRWQAPAGIDSLPAMTGKLAPLLLILLVPGEAAAQFAPSGAPGAWRCRAAAGQYETLDLPSAGDRVTVRMRIDETYEHPRWGPAAGFWFVLPGGRRRGGVQIFVDVDRRDRVMIGMRTPSSRGRPTIIASVARGATVEATVSLDREGRLTVAARGPASPGQFPGAAPGPAGGAARNRGPSGQARR